MGKVEFQIDLSFAVLLYSRVEKQASPMLLELICQSSDRLYNEILKRNFRQNPKDPQVFLYQDNQKDEFTVDG
jgi:hypothetical protein